MTVALLPVKAATARTAEARRARGEALRWVLGTVADWPEDARFDVAERTAILVVDGQVPEAEAEGLAVELVRADLLRRLP